MDLSIFAILAQDGITSGAVYALLSLALVLVFSVTRVIFIPQGEFVAYGALTLAALQSGKFPASAWLLVALGVLTFVAEGVALLRQNGQRRRMARLLPLAAKYLFFPIAVALTCRLLPAQTLPMIVQIALACAVVVPMGPMLYRIAYQPLANASILVLLIVSVGVHLAMTGLGLVMFGAEGARTLPFTDAQFQIGTLSVSGQSLVVIVVALAMIAALYLYFERSLSGKALRATAVNRLGARLVGIGTNQAGRLAFTLAAALGVLCGILIAPMTAMYYESGFIISLKGFVGAIFGGLAIYPLAAAGSLLVGLLESYASFWASAFKEVIVFTLIIPVLLWRSLNSSHADHDE